MKIYISIVLILFISCSKSPDPSKNTGTWSGSMISTTQDGFILSLKVSESDQITGTFKNAAQLDYSLSGTITDNKFNINLISNHNEVYGTASGIVYTNMEMNGTFYLDDKAVIRKYSGTFNVKKK